eukprot:Hpha_TRINITY_DN12106_c0_g1::TRINITY_DN12106_c0_g1_i1::g.81917::m.81917
MPSPVRRDVCCRAPPPSPLTICHVSRRMLARWRFVDLPPDIVAEVLTHLPPSSLLSAELSCRRLAHVVQQRSVWREAYRSQVSAEDWRLPSLAPQCWKRYYHQVRQERGLAVCAKVPLSSARVVWRVPLPCTTDSTRRRSREFTFSADALGEPIKWQVEIELARAVPVEPSDLASDRGVMMLDSGGVLKRCRQSGLVRMWTTNQWTTDATRHYYGSHCTVSLRDSTGSSEIREEEGVDIDNSQALEFDAGCLPQCREAVIHIHLTLALERAAPLNPFYRLIADTRSGESDTVRIGYCKAVFEVARCKRKSGAIFVRPW